MSEYKFYDKAVKMSGLESQTPTFRVVDLGNYYGCLCLLEYEERHYACVENYSGFHWEEVSDDFYKACEGMRNE